jgi:hypothetical protein
MRSTAFSAALPVFPAGAATANRRFEAISFSRAFL